MSEEKKITEEMKRYEETVSADRSKQKSRKIFVFYIIGLFCVALGLILISYVMQAHANQQLAELGTQLTVQTDAAKGAKARADQLQETIDTIQAQLDANQKQVEELNKKLKLQEQSMDALTQLWKLEQAYQNNEVHTARSIIAAMDESYGNIILMDDKTAPLTGESAKEYAHICAEMEYKDE